MKNLVPHFIQEQLLSDALQGEFEAYAMFVDLSGFTSLTAVLMQEGKAGAERLSNILNAIFEPMVAEVYRRGGFIPYFAGDAFSGIFPTSKCHCSAADVLDLAKSLFDLLNAASVHFGEFKIGIKTGLSFGRIEWGIVGNQHKSFYFRGPAIEGSAEAQSNAGQREIIIDRPFMHRLPSEERLRALEDSGYFQVEDVKRHAESTMLDPVVPALSKKVASQFLKDSVIEFNQKGEFRTVVPVFIAFEGVDEHQSLDHFATIVLDHVHNFSGYFKEIDFGDKGGVMVVVWGAPVSFENNVERALEFICALHEDLAPIQQTTGLRYKAGIATGVAYTGIVGGKERCQYAAVGNRVNVAARLMMHAEWGQVLVDGEVQKNRHFRFQHRGDFRYKGLQEPVPTWLLAGRNVEQRQVFDGAMVGRTSELKRLADFALTAIEQKAPSVAYVYGEPGIGKTRLSFELRHRLRRRMQLSWFTCQSDQILRKPFNPFIYLLRNYFEQAADQSPQHNLDSFEKQYESLLNDLIDVQGKETEGIKREIIRTKPVLAALVGLKTANSLWENLDAKGRYQNTLAALSAFFLAEALLQPVVLELEDGHWFDDSSRDFLNDLAGQIKGFPAFILVTSRYDDEGNKPRLFQDATLQRHQIPIFELDLNVLDTEAMHTFACERLHHPVHPNLVELLMRTANGNPFYAEQMLEYFMESDLLEQSEQGWVVTDKNVGISDSIQAVLTARIDRLSSLVKETIKAAAVIGREFELPVLTEVMKQNDEMVRHNGNAQVVLKEQVQTAEKAQIWQAMNELRYIFRHSLLREAVYDMQLKTRLKELHQLIAEAIENLYVDSLEQRYVDLVFHYEQAANEEKLRDYLQKAADYAKAHYQNFQSLHFYNKLLELQERDSDPLEKAKTLLKKGSILELIGRWDECETLYRSALEMSRSSNDSRLLGRANNNLGYLLMLKGKYEEADSFLETAAAFFGSIHDNRGTSKVYGNLGTLYFRQGKYEDAKLYFIRSIQLAQLYKHTPAIAQIVATLGLTYMNLGKYDDGIRWQQSQLDLCKQMNDKQGMAALYVNLGIVYFEKGDFDAALGCYERGLALSEELGNKQLTSIAIGCIGNVWQRKGKFDLAMQHFERDLALVEELGDKQGICIALGLIGELYSVMGEFDKAVEYMERNLAIGEELGYRKGVAKSLNVLGDIYYYKNDFNASLDYYDRSIVVTKGISNKLVLGLSLVEKGRVLVAIGKLENARLHLDEVLQLARDLNHPDLFFEARLLEIRLAIALEDKTAAKKLLDALLESHPGKREQAALHYKYSKIEEGSFHKEQALILYRELYKDTAMFVYKVRIEELDK